MTTPTDRPDPGLPEAAQRYGVGDCDDFAANVQHLVNPLVGWLRIMQADGESLADSTPADMDAFIDRLRFVLTLAERESGLAARADYPDVDAIVRNAKAEALDEAARDYELMYQQPGSASGADWLRRRAAEVAAIREGRTDGG